MKAGMSLWHEDLPREGMGEGGGGGGGGWGRGRQAFLPEGRNVSIFKCVRFFVCFSQEMSISSERLIYLRTTRTEPSVLVPNHFSPCCSFPVTPVDEPGIRKTIIKKDEVASQKPGTLPKTALLCEATEV